MFSRSSGIKITNINSDCLKQNINPETTIIAFDLHNVVFKKKYHEMAFSALKNIPLKLWLRVFSPYFWTKLYKFKGQSTVAEDIFRKLVSEYPELEKYRNEFIAITNAQKPINATVQLIAHLKQKGYKLYVLSNIGNDTYNQLIKRYPEIFNHFDGAFTAKLENNYCQKPDPLFYEQFKSFLLEQNEDGKQIIFVDDLKRNIASAIKANIAGIRFTSARQLKSIFKSLNVI